VSSTRRLTISGGSGSSGLFAYRSEDGSFAVSVLVYPKAWPYGFIEGLRTNSEHPPEHKEPDPGFVFQSANTTELQAFSILLREGKKVGLELADSAVPAVRLLIDAMNRRRQAWRRDKKLELAMRSGKRPPTDDDLEESDLELATETGTTLPVECSLQFRLDDSVGEPLPVSTPETDSLAVGYLTVGLRDLAWLCLRAGALRSAATDGGGEESAGQLLDAARAADKVDPLALLAELDFVHEMHRLQHRIRKGYVPEEDRLAAIRGRITDRGVLEYEMTGIPLLECRFDEFVEATPLFRVLVTALDVVSAGSLRSSLGVQTDGLFGSMSEVHPTTMREQLRSIPSLPLPVARATADRLRLTRLQQEWQRPLDLAKRILRAESVETGYATQEGSMTVWTVDTPKVWECILEKAFGTYAGLKVDNQQGMQPPWKGLGSLRRPDITLQTSDNKTLLVDAKYKLGTPGSSTADQYQMFAYSLINEVRPDAVALVYPSVGEESVKAYGLRRARQTTNLPVDPTVSFVTPSLHLLSAPFPRPETVRDELSWTTYLARVGEGLVEVLTC
jgi:hypothetical protein